MSKKEFIEDDVHDSLEGVVSHRLPWLIIGLLGGIIVTFIISKYEKVLTSDVRLAFFIPIIVYMSDAIGTQTATVYIRNVKNNKYNFTNYLIREILLGLCLGFIFGLSIFIITYYWLDSYEVALTVGLAMLINVTLAPIIAVIIANLIRSEKQDPALGATPVATIIQDLISIIVFFIIASLIILK